jgi:hypothetical protein
MEEKNYPAIYRVADSASILAQNRYLCSVRLYCFLLIFAAGTAVYGLHDRKAAILAGSSKA